MKILVPIRAGQTSDATLEHIVRLRQQFGSTPLTLLHVVNLKQMDYRMIPDFQIDMIRRYASDAGQALLDKGAALLHDAGLAVSTRLESGYPRDVISQIANTEHFDLLIIGRHRRGGLRDALFGSVSNHVLHEVDCPVLLF